MMPTTDQLVRLLDDSQLLSVEALAELRSRVAKAPGKVDPRSITKWLVQKRLITVEQALDFLDGRIPTTVKAEPEFSRKVAGEELLLADDLEVVDENLQVVDDDLQVVDEDLQVVDDDLQVVDEELEVVDDAVDELEVVDEASPAPTPRARPPKQPVAQRDMPRADRSPASPSASVRSSSTSPVAMLPAADPFADPGLPGMPSGGLGGAFGGATITPLGKKKKGKGKGNVWDSPLLLFGGGTLLGLVLLGGVLYWAIGRTTGDEALRLAEADYQSGSYTQAVHKFDRYLQDFPKHSGVGTARVHRGLAYMRQVIDGSSDWTKALAASKETLDEIAQENEFAQARAELAALLPRVAEGLAEQARRKPDRELVEQTSEALALVEKYVPRTLRPTEQLQEVEQSLALTRLQLARGESLQDALKKIETAIAAGRPSEAYEVRKELLKVYPDLEQDASLQKAVLAVSQSEKKDVAMVDSPQSAMDAEPESQVTATVALVTHKPGQIAAQATFLARADGAVYALEAASGKTLWRRYVGYDGPAAVTQATRQSTPHALLVDSVRRELVCVTTADNRLAWRQSLGDSPTAELLVMRNRVAAATSDGRVLLVDLDTGDSPGFIKFPHRLDVAPATDARGRYLYQLASHSNLYVVSAQSGQCDEVIYLGHEADSIRVPPLAVGKYLLIAENNGAASSTLRVFTTDDEGLNLRLVQSVSLEGHIHVQPQVTQSKTLLVITDRGVFYTFDIGASEKKPPLTQVASRPSLDDRPLVRFAIAQGAEFWVADQQLSKFDIQAAQGRLSPKWEQNRGDVFLQPLEIVDDCLIHVRRKQGQPGVAVAASKMSDGAIVWETHLAAPLAGQPLLAGDEPTIMAVNLAGGKFQLPAQSLESDVGVSPPGSYSAPEYLVADDSRSAITDNDAAGFSLGSGSTHLLSGQLDGKGVRLRSIALPGPLSMGPVAFGDSLLAGTRTGQLLLLDPINGQPAAEPFQPRLESGLQIEWRSPAMTGEGDIVIADSLNRVFRLRQESQPRANLALQVEKQLRDSIATPLAATGEYVYGATEQGQLLALQIADLEIAADWKLPAPVTWGPYSAGDQVLIATADGSIASYSAKQEQWRLELQHGPLVGAPLLIDGQVVLTAKSGVVYAVNPSDGQESSQVDVGQPLGAGAVLLGKDLLLTGHDGVLLRAAAP